MKNEIMYIELKSGYSDNGPAWIGKVNYSKSGQTIYFDGKAIKYATGIINGNSYDIQTREIYWISGVKKNQEDRHWAGSGKVMIDKDCVNDYLKIIGKKSLDMRHFEIVSLAPSVPSDIFHDTENRPLSTSSPEALRSKKIGRLSKDDLVKLINLYSEKEKGCSLKARRYFAQRRIAAEMELEKRESESKL